jgi:LacI family repressor for deo operon, udp, cdd, tsx, nupC, and nupG
MLNLGHKRICYLAGPADVPIYQDRILGYMEALKERKIPVDYNLIVNCTPDVQGGYDAISSMLHDADNKFSAIVASGDIMAIGAIRALKDYGLKVPDDMAISGFDDIPFAALVSPSLTTVRQPRYQIGVRTMEKLLDLIAGKTLVANRDVMNYELVIRESSGEFVRNRSL